MSHGEITNFYEQLPATGRPKQLAILLHGVGSNGRDLISLAPYYAGGLPEAVFVSPDAPFICDMMPPGYPDSYQWFSLQNRDPDILLQGVKNVFPILEAFIEGQLSRFDLAYEKLALIGFSQGTMTSLYAAPRLRSKIAGVLGYSGALLWDESEESSGFHKMPIHLIHGQADDVVPVQAWDVAKTVLETMGYDVSGQTTPGLTHSIDQAGIETGTAFLQHVFS